MRKTCATPITEQGLISLTNFLKVDITTHQKMAKDASIQFAQKEIQMPLKYMKGYPTSVK